MNGRILVVDDDRSMCEMLDADLGRRGLRPTWFTSAEQALTVLQDGDFDVLLADLHLPGMGGIELCKHIAANRPDIPVIVITAFGSLETAVAAMRAGAYDFVTKPVDLDILALALQRAVNHRELREKVRVLTEAVERPEPFGELLGDSEPMRALHAHLARISDTDASVLITGETGTGKELVARALHEHSRRREGPFVAVNCAALPEALLESELFGHKRGAFTDAKKDRRGLILQAEGGTLFLDEIGDFPVGLQPKLFRALEERRVRPIGSDAEVTFDVRIISATNRDLESAMEDGRFREDLFYRIDVVHVAVPPLRSRGTDVLLLAQRFLEQCADRSGKRVEGISNQAAEKLLKYSWPGNVRELRNAIEHAVALTRYDRIAVEDLPEKIREYRSTRLLIESDNPTDLVPMEEVERRYILHTLKIVGGNRTVAARVLGFDRKTLYRKLQRFGVTTDG